MTLTQNITLDVARETALHIAGKQFDENSRFLLVTIKEAGEEKSIPAGSTITLNARRPDGSAQSFAGSIQDGKALVEIDQWILEQYGTVYCSVSVVDSSASKLTTLSFRLLVERAEGSGFVLVYVAAAALAAGTYYITMAGVNYSFTTTEVVPAGGKIYFSSNGTTGKTTNNGATIEELTLTAGSTGTELQGSDIVNFLTQMQANVAAIDGELDSKADKSAIEDNLAAGTSLATIDKNSYTPNTSPYLYRQSPSGKRCEYDVIGGTVGWNQLVQNGNFADTSSWVTANGTLTVAGNVGTFASTSTSNKRIQTPTIEFIANHKYHIQFDYISDNNFTLQTVAGSKSISSANSWTSVSFIDTRTTTAQRNIIFYDYSGSASWTLQLRNVIIIDLTTLLGSTIADYAYSLEQATAGSGIAWLKSFGFLTKSYYPYTEPTLVSVQATARTAYGINQWDEEWEVGAINQTTGEDTSSSVSIRAKNYIPLIKGITYNAKIPQAIRAFYYDDDKGYISTESIGALSAGRAFNPPSNAAFMRFQLGITSAPVTTYADNICISVSNSATNAEYFPHESHTYPLGNTTLRGIPKLDSNNNIYYDGDRRKADGTVNRRFLLVDLGSKNYTMQSGNIFYCTIADMRESNSAEIVTTLPYTRRMDIYTNWTDYDKVYGTRANYDRIYFKDTSYATADAFKTAMSGVYLVCELATPTTESTDPFTPIQYTGSTEEFTTSNDVPVGIDAKYYTDLTLPKLPTTNGTYTLKCTVTDGTGIVSWVSE